MSNDHKQYHLLRRLYYNQKLIYLKCIHPYFHLAEQNGSIQCIIHLHILYNIQLDWVHIFHRLNNNPQYKLYILHLFLLHKGFFCICHFCQRYNVQHIICNYFFHQLVGNSHILCKKYCLLIKHIRQCILYILICRLDYKFCNYIKLYFCK